ncbi:NUDIX hydrolase [Longispora albida]|uniref:NUDIX hydrolase n=1 Tax=Longispora albida TaxID=203523 RepID=UPI0003A785C8|nr:NUDIX hydrolase [Longispora albida]
MPIAAAVVVSDGRVLLVRRKQREGQLSWQFPAGEVEPGETGTDAAVREAHEETDLIVRAIGTLGNRAHLATGRTMIYVACEVLSGTARVADEEELAEVEWCDGTRLAECIPYPLFGPVRAYLDEHLRKC